MERSGALEGPIREILARYEGQDVFVAVEVLRYDEQTCEPLTGRLIGTTPDRREASKLIRGHKCAMVEWTGKRAEAIILHAHPIL